MANRIDIDSAKFKSDIAFRVKRAREKKFGNKRGAQAECAEAIGVSPQSWRKYENGMLSPGSEKIAFLAEFFDVDPTWLLTGHGSIESPYPTEYVAHAQNEVDVDEANVSLARLFSLLAEFHQTAICDGKAQTWLRCLHILERACLDAWQAHQPDAGNQRA